jgi:DNA-binding MarR family transcriptional regulator
MTGTTPIFDQRLIGQTEKAMNAILDRLLAGTGVTEPEWVTLVLTAAGGAASHDEHAARVAGALKVEQATAASHIQGLVTKGLLQISPQSGPTVTLTLTGQQLVNSIQVKVGEITGRLWGDLPAADLQIAGRVLSTVLERADSELAAGSRGCGSVRAAL